MKLKFTRQIVFKTIVEQHNYADIILYKIVSNIRQIMANNIYL